MKQLFHLFLISILISACSTSEESNADSPTENQNVLTLDAFNEFILNRTDGFFSLSNPTTVAAQDANCAEVFGAFTFEGSNNTKEGSATIGGIEVIANQKSKSGLSADDLFGQKTEFVITRPISSKNSSSNEAIAIDSMYIPTKIKLLSPKLDFETDLIFPGMKITWNEDPLNDKGVVFTLIYEVYNNSAPITSLANKDFIRQEVTTDNGSYILPKSLFKDVPVEARVSLSISRGNFQYTNNEEVDEIYSLYTYTSIDFLGTYSIN